MEKMHSYKGFYKAKTCEVKAKSIYDAKMLAADMMKVRGMQRMAVAIVLLDDDGIVMDISNN